MIAFKNAINDMNAIRLAMIPDISVNPVTAPFDAASSTDVSDLIYGETIYHLQMCTAYIWKSNEMTSIKKIRTIFPV